MSNILSYFVVGRPEPEYGLPVAVIWKSRCWVLGCSHTLLFHYLLWQVVTSMYIYYG